MRSQSCRSAPSRGSDVQHVISARFTPASGALCAEVGADGHGTIRGACRKGRARRNRHGVDSARTTVAAELTDADTVCPTRGADQDADTGTIFASVRSLRRRPSDAPARPQAGRAHDPKAGGAGSARRRGPAPCDDLRDVATGARTPLPGAMPPAPCDPPARPRAGAPRAGVPPSACRRSGVVPSSLPCVVGPGALGPFDAATRPLPGNRLHEIGRSHVPLRAMRGPVPPHPA